MPINRSGADTIVYTLQAEARDEKIKLLEKDLDSLERKIASVNKSASKGSDTSAFSQFAKDAKSATTGTDSLIGGLRSLASSMAAVSAVVVAGGVAIGKAFEFSEEGAQLERLRSSADALAAHYGANMSSMLSSLQEYSQGTISNTDLILAADKAMMLGVTSNADEMGRLLEIAALRGRAMGVETSKAFNDIVTGLGRMSPRILDNLGIVIDADTAYAKYAESIGKTARELSDMEKRQALLNAVLEDGTAMLDDAGGLADDNAASYERLRASWTNLTDAMKERSAGAFTEINNWLATTFNNTSDLISEHERYMRLLEESGAGPKNDRQKNDYYNRMQGWDATAARYTGMGEAYSNIDPAPIVEAGNAQLRLNDLTGEYIGMNLADKMAMVDEAVQNLTFSTEDYFGLVMSLNEVETQYMTTMEGLALRRQEINEDQSLSDEERLVALDQIAKAEEAAATKAIESSEKIVFSILSQKLAADGNYAAILRLGEAWGLISPNVAIAGEQIMEVLDDGTLTADQQKQAIDDITNSMLGLPNSSQTAGEAVQRNLEPATVQLADAKSEAYGLKEQLDGIAKKSGSVWTFTVIINTIGTIPSLPSSNRDSDHYSCFAPGTKVLMADGSHKNIEDVRVGDMVMSLDTFRLVRLSARVEAVMRHAAHKVNQSMLVNGIRVTSEHPFYVNGSWKAAADVRVGDVLMDVNMQSVAVTSVEYVATDSEVYNLEVGHDTHNYFADGVLVHNKTREGDNNAGGGGAYAMGGQMGEGWSMVGEAGFELVSPTGYVFDHTKSQELIDAGIAPDKYYRAGGSMSGDEADYYASRPRGDIDRRTRRPRPDRPVGNHRRRGGAAGADVPAATDVSESMSIITEVVTQTTNMAGAVVETGQQQAQATATQTAMATAQNDAMLSELQNISRLLMRLPGAQEQMAIYRTAQETTVR